MEMLNSLKIDLTNQASLLDKAQIDGQDTQQAEKLLLDL